MNTKIKILLTAFDPFGEDQINSALETMMALTAEIPDAEIIKLQIPTVFGKSGEMVSEALRSYRPDAVLMLGMAGGRSSISVERIAINLADARIADNAGFQPSECAIAQDGPAAYFATLPIQAMVKATQAAGIPAAISNSAGTFVCNHLMYSVLQWIDQQASSCLAGFVHLPYLPQQVAERPNFASMSLEKLVEGVGVCLTVIAEELKNQAAAL